MRIVIDTNVLIASAYNPRSASRRIVTACLRGQFTLVISPDVQREYEYIISRAVPGRTRASQLWDLIAGAEVVQPVQVPRVVADDPEDDKFLAAAVAGQAEALITNDQHLLKLTSYEGIPCRRPADFATNAF